MNILLLCTLIKEFEYLTFYLKEVLLKRRIGATHLTKCFGILLLQMKRRSAPIW